MSNPDSDEEKKLNEPVALENDLSAAILLSEKFFRGFPIQHLRAPKPTAQTRWQDK